MRSQRRKRAAQRGGRRCVVAAVSCLAVLVLCVAGGVAAGAATDLPLPAAVETPADAWTVLPMGQLGNLDNTFWQLLRAAPGSSQWSVVTPEGVADNGGLVAAAGASTASITVGFLPSQLLRFSPLSASTDAGRTWSPAFLPGALAARPSALASGSDGSLAVVGAAVLHQPSNGSKWSTLVTLTALRRLAPQCGAAALDAVAVTPTGAALVGTACRGGRFGLFTASDSTWHLDASALRGDWRDASTTVLRLQAGATQTTALVMATQGGRQALFALSQTGSGDWQISAPLSIGAGSTVRATAVGSDGSLSILVGSERSVSVVEIVPGGTWTTTLPPPRGAVALAVAPPDPTSVGAGSLDVFTVQGGTELHVFVLAGSGWVGAQTLQVPLPYGSSS